MNMPQWWGPEDDAILRGEMAKLAELPRPAYVERRMHELVYVPITGHRQPRSVFELCAAVVLACLLVLALILALIPSPQVDPAPAATPSTYGWPGPGGGPS